MSAIEGTANTPPRTWEPIFDGAVGAVQRVGKRALDSRGVGNPRLKVASHVTLIGRRPARTARRSAVARALPPS
jgi:hypothetical protein